MTPNAMVFDSSPDARHVALARQLESFSPYRLAPRPSPLQSLARLGKQLGLDALMIKRDDLQPIGGGGNKLRKLEYLVADALAAKADILVTGGALQSNHARLTASVAAHLGLDCDLLLIDRVPRTELTYRTGANRTLNQLFGARTVILEAESDLSVELEKHCDQLHQDGQTPCLIPFGGSNWRGALGYVDMVIELADQLTAARAATIVCACGSGGMLAGILAGVAALGLDWKVLGVSVLEQRDAIKAKVAAMANETLAALNLADTALPEWDVLDQWIGPGYGIPGDFTDATLARLGTVEGVVLDPVYTGKAMEGLLALAEHLPSQARKAPVIFVHSGGQAGLFAYPDLFQVPWPGHDVPTGH